MSSSPATLTERLASIRAKRDRLMASPRGGDLFGECWGAFRTQHFHGTRAKVEDVAAFEAEHGFRFPEEYRRFITEIGDGGASPGCGLFTVKEAMVDAPEWTGDPSRPFCCGNDDAQRVIAREAAGEKFVFIRQPNDDGLPHGAILLAHTGCGCFDILIVTGEQRGTVWFHDTQSLAPYTHQGRQISFLDWYENWLDACLKRA